MLGLNIANAKASVTHFQFNSCDQNSTITGSQQMYGYYEEIGCSRRGSSCGKAITYNLTVSQVPTLPNAYLFVFQVETYNERISDGTLFDAEGNLIPQGEMLKINVCASNIDIPDANLVITKCDKYPELVDKNIEFENQITDEAGFFTIQIMIETSNN